MKRRESESEHEENSRKVTESERKTSASNGRSGRVASLHRSVGNQAVQQLVDDGVIQPKLEAGSPSGPAEREAEKTAERVVNADRAPEGATESGAARRESAADVTPSASIGRSAGDGRVSGEAESAVRDGVRGGGKPLPEETRSNFEAKMGTDFSDVRVHTGSAADRASRSIDAEAYTMGSDIAFARGNYDPGSNSGKKLLAHELTHVAQSGGVGRSVHRFESSEHTEMGSMGFEQAGVDDQTYELGSSGNVVCTYGQLAAMGRDYFTGIPEMNRLADDPSDVYKGPEQLRYVRDVEIDYSVANYVGDSYFEAKRDYAGDEKVAEEAEARMYGIAADNNDHFVNSNQRTVGLSTEEKLQGGFPSGSSLEAYRTRHVRAIEYALQLGEQGMNNDRALAEEGIAAHHLTDSFASGHLVAPAKEMRDHWNQEYPMFWENLKKTIAEGIALYAKNEAGYFEVPAKIYAASEAQVYSRALTEVENTLQSKNLRYYWGDMVSGAIHDAYNKTGVRVEIKGETQIIRGDGQLQEAARTAGANAVEAGVRDVRSAHDHAATAEKSPVYVPGAGVYGFGEPLVYTDPNSIRQWVSSRMENGLFPPEQYLPRATSDWLPSEGKQEGITLTEPIDWKQADPLSLIDDSQPFRTALRNFLGNKADKFESVAGGMDAAWKQNALNSAVVTPLKSDPIGTVKRVINWTPSALNEHGIDNWRDDRVREYIDTYQDSISKFTYEQVRSLVSSLIAGNNSPEDQSKMLMLLRDSEHTDAIIEEFGWSYLHNQFGPGYRYLFEDEFSDQRPE